MNSNRRSFFGVIATALSGVGAIAAIKPEAHLIQGERIKWPAGFKPPVLGRANPGEPGVMGYNFHGLVDSYASLAHEGDPVELARKRVICRRG